MCKLYVITIIHLVARDLVTKIAALHFHLNGDNIWCTLIGQ